MLRLLLLPGLLALLSLSGCQSTSSKKPVALTPDAQRSAAMLRSARLSGLAYRYRLTLGEHGFEGTADIQFNLNDTTTPLSLDAKGLQLSAVTINGRYLYPDYNGTQLTFSPALLSNGSNRVTLTFSGQYQQNGSGLISLIDPEDGRQYLYSHFEPNGASRVFPLFDQPDLPARFTLDVTAPSDWEIISGSRPMTCDVQVEDDTRRCTAFDTRLTLSPHNMSLHAGPFVHWQNTDTGLPLALYARQSQQCQVDAANWLSQTRQQLGVLEIRLGSHFPFDKYDQLLVQDSQTLAAQSHSGAAAVAFIRPTEADAGSISYQLARQWFGNLVSIDWWHNRWLADAISQFLSMQPQAPQIQVQRRAQAYQADSLPESGHAVGAPSHYLAQDPIINTKAVAALEQLQAQLGGAQLDRVLQAYLQTYAGQAAGASEFLEIAQRISGRNLQPWFEDFITGRGINLLQARVQCRDGVVEALTLEQQPDLQGRLRHQSLRIGLYHADRQGVHLDKVLPVMLSGNSTKVTQATNLVCPDFIWPNEDNLGYLRVLPDEHSLSRSRLHLGQIHQPLTSLLLWQSLWQSVLDGHLPAREYLALVMLNAPQMSDLATSQQLQSQLQALAEYLAAGQHRESERLIDAMAQLSLQRAMETGDNRVLQQTWLDTYLTLAQSREALDHLASLLDSPAGRLPPLTQEQRFAILLQLTRFDHPATPRLLRSQNTLQPLSDTQQLMLRAVSPKALEKRALLAKLPLMADAQRRPIMASLYPPEQKLLSEASQDLRLGWLQDEQQPLAFRYDLASLLLHPGCDNQWADKWQRLAKASAQPQLMNKLEQQAQWTRQCTAINQQP
ncbi:M1 family aminopeptidase [Shewanella sp. GXUN23E]|uniref:M1 family aminopeptidase n=1 Tax=Shewanella sp. GXUN23E TaxID=3422498 RepID=UPI003D7D8287